MRAGRIFIPLKFIRNRRRNRRIRGSPIGRLINWMCGGEPRKTQRTQRQTQRGKKRFKAWAKVKWASCPCIDSAKKQGRDAHSTLFKTSFPYFASLFSLCNLRVLVCSKRHQNRPPPWSNVNRHVLLPLVASARRRAQRGVMRTRRPAHDRKCPGLQRPSQSQVQAGPASYRPNSRQSSPSSRDARIRKTGPIA